MTVRSICAINVVLMATSVFAKGPAYTDPNKTDPDFPFQGEYAGTIKTNNGDLRMGLQVIALGGGKFHSVAYRGGLPGDGWDKGQRRESDGERMDGAVVLKSERATATLQDGKATLKANDGAFFGTLNKIERKSP